MAERECCRERCQGAYRTPIASNAFGTISQVVVGGGVGRKGVLRVVVQGWARIEVIFQGYSS